jgi:hypothetical protein
VAILDCSEQTGRLWKDPKLRMSIKSKGNIDYLLDLLAHPENSDVISAELEEIRKIW